MVNPKLIRNKPSINQLVSTFKSRAFFVINILSANKLLSSSSTGKNDFRLTLKRIRTNKTRRTNKQESMNLIGLYISVSRCPVYKDDLQNLNNLQKVLTSREALDIAFSFTALATKVILQIKRTSL